MSRRQRLMISLGLVASGCAHGPTPAAVTQPVPCAAASAPQVSERVGLYDVVWRMQRDDDARTSWTALPDALHAFALGPWECALGPLQASDRFAEGLIERVRRLACTHKSGATMQTELRCELKLPLVASAVASARRDLSLALSDAPQARVACEAESRDRLEVVHGSGSQHAALCLTDARLHACESGAGPSAPSAQ